MKLADMLKTDWFGQVATATLATSATHGPKTLRSVATVATVTVAIPQNLSAANDQAIPKAPEPQSAPAPEPADWKALDRVYQAHHFKCPMCVAAGKNFGMRCGVGRALWAAYDAVDMPPPVRAASAAPATPQPATEIYPSLLTPATKPENDTMAARLALFDARGVKGDDAERLVDKLLVRDREGDLRAACVECRQLVGSGPGRWRCGDSSPTTVNELAGAGLGAAFVHIRLHRCPSFKEAHQ